MKSRAQDNLAELRQLWEDERDPVYLRQALSWASDAPLPEWLVEALKQNLTTVAPAERQQRVRQHENMRKVDAVRDAIYGGHEYPYFYALDGESASEANFRAAASRLKAEGLNCSPASVKKTWQRHKPSSYDDTLKLILED